jgi:hypothetical protein
MSTYTESLYSTNNSWGFGGSYGTEYRFEDGWALRKGTACFRHLPSHRIAYAIDPQGRRVLDLQDLKQRPSSLPEHVWALVKSSRKGAKQ